LILAFSFLTPGIFTKWGHNNNNNYYYYYDNVYGAIIMTKVIARVYGSFDECRLSAEWPPILGPSQTIWAATIHIHHRHCYYYSAHFTTPV